MTATDNPYVVRDGEQITITDEGRQYLSELVTDTEGSIYAFTSAAPPVMVGGAMARLSRNSNGAREIYLGEFANAAPDAADKLIERVVTGFGDDSVTQLTGLSLVVEGASNLLTKQLEWGRLASYLEQSTRYIFFDTKDTSGNYRYFVPAGLHRDVKMEYCTVMDKVFDLYSQMVRQLTTYVRERRPRPDKATDPDGWVAWPGATRAQACDAVRTVLPVATRSTVGIFGSAQAIDNLIMHLMSQETEEARRTGTAILRQVRQVMPAFFQRTDIPERGGATVAYKAANNVAMRELTTRLLPTEVPSHGEKYVRLIDRWPADEVDLLAEVLFASTDLSSYAIQRHVQGMNQDLRDEIVRTYCGERLNRRYKPGRAIEKAHLEWEIVDDYGTFRDLQRHRMVDAMEWQRLTPHFGYDVPELIKEAGLEGDFINCFALLESLYATLMSYGYEVEAQYATALGHRMRYRFITNLREAFHLIELRSGPQGHPGYRKIAQEMHRLLGKVYPSWAAAMNFVNLGEDPELTRLAAERATAYKLRMLGATD